MVSRAVSRVTPARPPQLALQGIESRGWVVSGVPHPPDEMRFAEATVAKASFRKFTVQSCWVGGLKSADVAHCERL